jgi:hypothetical protein
MVGSTVLSAAGKYQEGVSKRNAAYYNAAVAEQNAQYADEQAADSLVRGSEEVSKHYLQVGQMKAEQTAAMAANGIELGYGSPLEVIAGTAMLGEIDAETMRRNAKREAEGRRREASNYRAQATGYRAQGKADFVSGLLGAAGSLMSGASQIAGMGK